MFALTAIPAGEGTSFVSLVKSNGIPYLNLGSQRYFDLPRLYPNFFETVQSFYGNAAILGAHLLKHFPDAKIGVLRDATPLGTDALSGLQRALGSAAKPHDCVGPSLRSDRQRADSQ